MPRERLRKYLGHTYRIEPYGGAQRVDDDVDLTDTEDHSPKRLRGNTADSETMTDSAMDGTMTVAKATASVGTQTTAKGSQGTGETPVIWHEPQLGCWTETFTAILPLRFGVSFNKVTNTTSSANCLKIRCNAPYNILGETTLIQQTEAAATNYGVSAHQASAWTGTNDTAFASFETTIVGPTAPTATTAGAGIPADAQVIPAWRKWFENIYESYHTMECQYRITFVNPETTVGNRQRVYVDKDVYTTSSTGNVMPTDAQPLFLNSVFKNVDHHIVQERNNNDGNGWIKVIEGKWIPDTWSKNTLNAEDIKAWYSTGSAPSPNWVENLVLVVRPDEFCTNYTNLNCFVELRYIVQFKDLKDAFRYTVPSTTTVNLATPGDVLQVPTTRVAWGSEP